MQEQDRYLSELLDFLRIPSVSTDPARKGDVRRAAEFVENQLRSAGIKNVRKIEGNGHPMVYGEWLEAPGKPTLLLYGHYDVQPAEPLEEWLSPPFEPTIRNNNVYARGAVDDKGQVMILLKAVERLMKRDGKLPVNIRVLIEGEEEVGGETIEHYVASKPADLKADAAIVCDTEMFAPELPTICVGLRGIIYGEIHVSIGESDLHSGVFGGAVPNAIMATAEIITKLKDADGRILIPGFYDRVQPPSAEERAAWARLPFDEKEYCAHEAKVWGLTGEPGVPILERLWARPTLEIHGIRGGFIGEGAKTVIPARAAIKISCRLVPDMQPDEAIEQLSKAVAAAAPKGTKAEYKFLHGGAASLTDPANPFVAKGAEALSEAFGKQTVFTRGGGSIPIVGLFQKHLGIPSVLMGFGLPDDNLHAPNEKFHLPNYYRGIEAVGKYLEKLGK